MVEKDNKLACLPFVLARQLYITLLSDHIKSTAFVLYAWYIHTQGKFHVLTSKCPKLFNV